MNKHWRVTKLNKHWTEQVLTVNKHWRVSELNKHWTTTTDSEQNKRWTTEQNKHWRVTQQNKHWTREQNKHWTTEQNKHREQAPRINSGNSRPSPSLFLGVNREGTKFFLHFFAILGGLVPPLSYFWVPKPQIPQISQISDPRICANFTKSEQSSRNQASDSR